AERIESAEGSFVGSIAKNETQVTPGCARGQQTLYRGSCVAKGAIGIALAISDNVVQCLIAQVDVDHFLPEMIKKLFSRRHALLMPPWCKTTAKVVSNFVLERIPVRLKHRSLARRLLGLSRPLRLFLFLAFGLPGTSPATTQSEIASRILRRNASPIPMHLSK